MMGTLRVDGLILVTIIMIVGINVNDDGVMEGFGEL